MTYRHPIVLAVVVGILLALPSLWVGFIPSDLPLIAQVEGWYPQMGQSFNVYAFFRDLPTTPWWTSPHANIAFWRPLASALLRLDNWLFGRHTIFYHLHSLVWLAALIVACGLLYLRLPGRVGVLALLILVLDESHISTIGWICNRHAVVSIVPALFGLLAHLRWREERWRPGRPLALVGFVAGLLGGETALSILAYAMAYELFAGAPDASPALSQRLRGLWPLVLLAGGYVVAYRAMGFGVSGTSIYLDPANDPIAVFLGGLAERLPPLVASTLWGFPAALWWFEPLRAVQIVLAVAGVLGCVGLVWLLRSDLESTAGRELRWLLAGGLASLLPAAFPPPDDRLLSASMIGFAPLLAFFLDAAWRRGWSAGALRRLAVGAFVLVVVAAHGAMPLVARYLWSSEDLIGNRYYTWLAAQLPLDPSRRDQQLIVVNGPGEYFLNYFPLSADLNGSRIAEGWHVLSEAPYDLRLGRTGPRTLEIELLDGSFFESRWEQFFRSPAEPLRVGDVVDTWLFQAEILAANDRGPTRVAFHFDRDLGAAELIFLVWEEDGLLRQVKLPAVGEILLVKWYPVPWDLLFFEPDEETDEDDE